MSSFSYLAGELLRRADIRLIRRRRPDLGHLTDDDLATGRHGKITVMSEAPGTHRNVVVEVPKKPCSSIIINDDDPDIVMDIQTEKYPVINQITRPVLTTAQKRKRDEEDPLTSRHNKMVQVLVGPEESSFRLFENDIRVVPFFRGCLDATMIEADEKIVRMPEDDAAVFEAAAYFIRYHKLEKLLAESCKQDVPVDVHDSSGQNQPRSIDRDARAKPSKVALQLYFLANKLMYQPLQDAVFADIESFMKGKCFATYEIKMIEEKLGGQDGDQLREYVLKSVAEYIHHFKGWKKFDENGQIKYREARYRDVAGFVIEALVKYPSNGK
ncbi:uncharacterized protein AB675_7654 [Cyphellophora attinorum]|uniref:BTB domain-containing protein n=1 Tax=Cyphellophora attinorum TaxID=1664694 RepID=A0A0N1P1B9_9EURO|nr:uncharacterized protein AB675_7654 [Phialophora attinorum]KPI40454.1 hypothetical protein AB675_7654 [Phialophora attinorum]